MGGGKSRALCEEAFQAALDYPGIEILMVRQEHTAIVGSTRKTMFREVLPPELIKHCRIVKSGGYDFIEFPWGSVINFIGLSNPVSLHSTEYGMALLDEAHQIAEEDVTTILSRLRQKCASCTAASAKECDHLPYTLVCAANPENPGHWLYRAFIEGAVETEWGYYKPDLRMDEDAAESVGDAEFIQARATDNPYLPSGYIQRRLASMPPFWRERYLEGKWRFISGNCYFDVVSLDEYSQHLAEPKYRMDFEPRGIGDKAARRKHKFGKLRVYVEPRKSRTYAIGADVATGHGLDYSCAYVVDLNDMALVAEFHGKLDPDVFAEQLHFLGRWYGRASDCEHDALLAVESAGGFGEPVVIALRDGKGGRPPYSRLYRHTLDSQIDMPLTKRYGYPINTKTRPQVLSQLARSIREKSLPWMTQHLLNECLTFCEFEEGTPSPRAQPGCHDDAVMAAAITLELYRQKGLHPEREARVARRRKARMPKFKKTLARGVDVSPWATTSRRRHGSPDAA